MDSSIDFQPYLDSICHQYNGWWEGGVLTDSERQQEEPFNFDLQAREIKTKAGKTSKSEEFRPPLPVIEALDQLVKTKKQILLVGQPGAGKTKTLWRYLLKLAEQAKQGISAEIPILIRLKDYQISSDGKYSGLVHLIRKELISLEPEAIERYLFLKQRFLLLIDGLNESTSPELRRDLQHFLNNCSRHQVPVVFTTRSLGYRDLEIETQLEIQSISPEERQRFLTDRVSPSNQHKLQRWLKRTHQSNYTPFVLWMLAEICQQAKSSSELAENFSLGQTFQEFIRLYQDRLYEEGRVSEEDCEAWSSHLKQLAFEMLSNEKAEDHFVSTRRKTLDILESETLLNNLIRHHLLIERRDDGKVEFCHQLLQEYYAAEWLFERLPHLTDEQLKYYFLNYLKWTEAIALMLGLVKSRAKIVQCIKIALEVDLMLGAKLAGVMHIQFQRETIDEIKKYQLPRACMVYLLGSTRSKEAIKELIEALEEKNHWVRSNAIEALGEIEESEAVAGLIKAIEDPNLTNRLIAVRVLAEFNNELSINELKQALNCEEAIVRNEAKRALEAFTKQQGNQCECPSLSARGDKDFFYSSLEEFDRLNLEIDDEFCHRFPRYLKHIFCNEESSNNINNWIYVSKFMVWLGRTGNSKVIRLLSRLSKYKYYYWMRLRDSLVLSSRKQHYWVRRSAIEAMGETRDKKAIPVIMQALNDKDWGVCESAAVALEKLVLPETIPLLKNFLIETDSPYLLSTLSKIQEHCKFYNYNIAQSLPPPTINSKKLSADSSPTYNFYSSVENVANIVHGNQITNQQKDLKKDKS